MRPSLREGEAGPHHQILDGVGAGIFGALFFIVVADLTEGTGRYNLAQGASSACWGLGAALSNGGTQAEVKEIFLHVAAYCGAHAAIDSFRIARKVLADQPRKARKS